LQLFKKVGRYKILLQNFVHRWRHKRSPQFGPGFGNFIGKRPTKRPTPPPLTPEELLPGIPLYNPDFAHLTPAPSTPAPTTPPAIAQVNKAVVTDQDPEQVAVETRIEQFEDVTKSQTVPGTTTSTTAATSTTWTSHYWPKTWTWRPVVRPVGYDLSEAGLLPIGSSRHCLTECYLVAGPIITHYFATPQCWTNCYFIK